MHKTRNDLLLLHFHVGRASHLEIARLIISFFNDFIGQGLKYFSELSLHWHWYYEK